MEERLNILFVNSTSFWGMKCLAAINGSSLDGDVTRRRRLSLAESEDNEEGKGKKAKLPIASAPLTSCTAASHNDKPAGNDTDRKSVV